MFLFFRLKSEIDRKDVESEENLTRLTTKYQNEISDLKYSIQELEMSKKELQTDVNVLKLKESDSESIEELKTSVSQLKSRLELEERKNAALVDENDQLKEDMSYVSLHVICVCGARHSLETL